MKKLFLFLFQFTLWCYPSESQIAIEWQKCYGGQDYDFGAESIIQTLDGGFAFIGNTESNDGDVLGNHGGIFKGDTWVVKTDSIGNIQWQKCLGGSDDEASISIIQSPDSGFIVLSIAKSTDGDLISSTGGLLWLVKLSSSGVIVWSKNFAFTVNHVKGNHLQLTNDNGIIFAAIGSNLGSESFGIVKLDSAGNLNWQQFFGGSREDRPFSIINCNDGGYFISGSTTSGDGDVTGWHPDSTWESQNLEWIYSRDIWVIKLDVFGNLEWEKCYGGTDDEEPRSAIQTFDGGYIITGFSFSNNGDVTEPPNSSSCWVVKIDSVGNIQWNRRPISIGLDGYEVVQTLDSNYMIFGTTTQMLICKMDTQGNTIWYNKLGNYYGYGFCGIQASDGSMVGGGMVFGNGKDVTGHHGSADIWIVKFTERVNTIQGTMFIDNNNNTILDSGEVTIKNKMLTELNTGQTAYTDFNGSYMLSVIDTGSFQITPPAINHYSATPLMRNVQFSSVLETDSLNDFAYQAVGVVNDLCVSLTASNNFRSSMQGYYVLNYNNEGNTTLNPSIVFYPSPNITFTSSIPTPDIITQDSIVWNINTLNPFQSGSINITVSVNPNPIGTVISSSTLIYPVVNDFQPSCNYDTSTIQITGAVDPNDIWVNRNSIYDFEISNPPELEYLIRFQNIGNDTAFTVSVLNQISENLDINSFDFIASSHPILISHATYNNSYKFQFDNINLPDSNINEPMSHGFVRYRIKPKTSLIAGDTIPNSAEIYFDFNGGVFTNEVKTAIILPTGEPEFNNLNEELLLYPNPANETITIKRKSSLNIPSSTTQLIKVFDLCGKLILNATFDPDVTEISIDISEFPEGFYLLSVENGDHSIYSRFMKANR